ncbi:MAG: Rnase Y domain-containing protein, partial [Clostridia bacterium]|nr:Rnase Y domain-containing protein [Clostridia bacterium]
MPAETLAPEVTMVKLGMVIVIAVITAVIGVFIGYIIRKNEAEKKIGSAEATAKNIISAAENKSETLKKEALQEAKSEARAIRQDAERDAKERRKEIQRSEDRLVSKEKTIDDKLRNIERKEESISQKEQNLNNKHKDLDNIIKKQMEELEKISGYTVEEAKQILLQKTEKEVRHDASILIKNIEQKAKEEADKKAKYIITNAIQRCAADHV